MVLIGMQKESLKKAWSNRKPLVIEPGTQIANGRRNEG
jgi:hypothetical protein